MVSERDPWPRIVAAIAVAVLLLLAGIWLGGHPSWLPSPIRSAFVSDSGGQRVNDVLDVISRDYYRRVSRSSLVDQSLSAMVASLNDPYSHYYDSSQYQAFLDQSNPHFSGIGVDVLPDPAGLRVINVFPDTPAARAGLAHGDVIVKVGSTSLAGRTADFASSLIRGRAGTSVTLTVKRGARASVVTIMRATVATPVTDETLMHYRGIPIGYLQLTAFTSGSGAELRADTDKALRQGARALILDLRDNGGGLLDEAVNVASIFIPDGTIVTTRGRSQPTQVYVARGGAIRTTIPMVVLVNRDTASAAEIVTGALQDRGRALVIGTRTYGKGVFQEIEPLPSGGAIDLTVGEYFTPNGTNLGGGGVREGLGIRPNIYVAVGSKPSADPQLTAAERTVAGEVK
jgi:carboxyl-terminal processing protease